MPTPIFSGISMKRRNMEVTVTDPDLATPVSVDDAIGDLPEIPSGGGFHEIHYNKEWMSSGYQQFMRNVISFEELVRYQSG
jgi:hypothetical protein